MTWTSCWGCGCRSCGQGRKLVMVWDILKLNYSLRSLSSPFSITSSLCIHFDYTHSRQINVSLKLQCVFSRVIYCGLTGGLLANCLISGLVWRNKWPSSRSTMNDTLDYECVPVQENTRRESEYFEGEELNDTYRFQNCISVRDVATVGRHRQVTEYTVVMGSQSFYL